jgi:hypothetical protein
MFPLRLPPELATTLYLEPYLRELTKKFAQQKSSV